MACTGLGTYPEFHREYFGRIRSSEIHTGWIVASDFSYRRFSYVVMSSSACRAQPLMTDTIPCPACCEVTKNNQEEFLFF